MITSKDHKCLVVALDNCFETLPMNIKGFCPLLFLYFHYL